MYRAWQRRRAERGSSGGRSRGAGAVEADPPQTAPAVAIPNATDDFYTRLTAALEASAPALRDEGRENSAPTAVVQGIKHEWYVEGSVHLVTPQWTRRSPDLCQSWSCVNLRP